MMSAKDTTKVIMSAVEKMQDDITHLPSPSSLTKQQAIVVDVLAELEADQLDLPVLPEVVIKIREILADPDSSTGQLVQLLSTDLVISLYLIKAANSAAYSSGRPVGNLHEAIPRLGLKMLYSMVMNIALTKLFKAKSPLIKNKLAELMDRSHKVAANCYVLAKKKKHLKPEDAMLAGLVHEIGALPLYLYADRHCPEIDSETLENLINIFSAPIGFRLLQNWNFPDELVDVVSAQLDMRFKPQSDVVDYVDVVTMAKLQTQKSSESFTWTNVLSAERLGYYSGDCRDFLANHTEQFAEVNNLLRTD
ncbi:MAG: HDOD domain-containing protein [Gallionellaceae bacterium]